MTSRTGKRATRSMVVSNNSRESGVDPVRVLEDHQHRPLSDPRPQAGGPRASMVSAFSASRSNSTAGSDPMLGPTVTPRAERRCHDWAMNRAVTTAYQRFGFNIVSLRSKPAPSFELRYEGIESAVGVQR